MRLRQVVLVAEDLDAVVAQLCNHLGLTVCYRDPGVAEFGLRNALIAAGDTFLEVVSPIRPGTAAERFRQRRGGDCGYMVLIQVDNLKSERSRLGSLGVRIVWQGSGPQISGMHLHPADVGGAIVSFDVAEPAESWGWAGEAWGEHVGEGVVGEVAAVELRSDRAPALAERWSSVLSRPVRSGKDGVSRVIELDRGAVRFVRDSDSRGECISAFDLVATDRTRAGERTTIGGVEIRLV